MVTKQAYNAFMDAPISSKDQEIWENIEMSCKPMEKMDTLEFMVFMKLAGNEIEFHYPDMTDAKLSELFHDHIMDI